LPCPCLEKARSLLCTPLALEILDDLAQGRSPYQRPEELAIITTAVRCLESLGAARQSLSVAPDQPYVEITSRGQALYNRLVEIERRAARVEARNVTVTGNTA